MVRSLFPNHSDMANSLPVLLLLLFGDGNALSREVSSRRTFVGSSIFAVSVSKFAKSAQSEDTVASATPPASFSGEYWDPYHPTGFRTVKLSGNLLNIVGKDEPDLPTWKVTGDVNGNTAKIDFSSKGGPKDLTGTYVDKFGSVGISFPDGNRWVKVSEMQGLYSDPSHPEGYRLLTIYPLGFGSDYYIASIFAKDGPNKSTKKIGGRFTLPGGKLPPGQVAIDFSNGWGAPGQETIAKFDGQNLNFPDREKWSKLSFEDIAGRP